MEELIMNKRQLKKKRTFKEKKVKAVIEINLTNVSNNAHIDIYISNRFEATRENEQWFSTVGHNKKISVTKALARGKGYLISIVNGKNKQFGVTAFLSDTDKSYYVIRPNIY
jgi:S-adenosylmethionine:tRNA-ribosyltransferase-isomerase (queuine synthetase)